MKKLIFTVVLLIAAIGSIQAQINTVVDNIKPTNEAEGPLWRAITPTVRIGGGDFAFVQPSVNTFYQFSKDYALTSWIGAQFRSGDSGNWGSLDFLVNKLWNNGGTRLGTGFQYGITAPFQQVNIPDNNQVFFVLEFSSRFKLK